MWGSLLRSVTPGFGSVTLRFAMLWTALCSGAAIAIAQISPGELSSAHAGLEGLSKCTSCHSLGKTISSQKCLTCHTELASRISARKGLHARYAGKECVECHKEHHGRDFSIVHFDKSSFDHSQTGYGLEGKHARVDCEKCHSSGHITAADIKSNAALLKSRTSMGLSSDCLSCHPDTHRGQLSHDCLQCHVMDGWKPAAKFNHDRAKFPLTGKHARVECGKCHKPAAGEGSPIQFVRIAFSTCSSCHGDPHAGHFTKPCESCHTTAGWAEGIARGFDHSMTRYPLRGRHAVVPCEKCHAGGSIPAPPTGQTRFHIAKFSLCTDCHADPHRGQFTANSRTPSCTSCHTESGWKEGKASSFDHATTRFPLRGKHASLSCNRCHGKQETFAGTAGRVDVRRFERCADCHRDPHRGQFARRTDGGACESCHTESGFKPSVFSTQQHDKTRFPLKGAHEAIPCVSCHRPEGRGDTTSVVFVRPGEIRCADCHQDIHRDRFEGVKTSECSGCHATDQWATMVYAHDRTSFPLTGKHVGLSCASCHVIRGTPQDSPAHWRYRGTPSRCVDCHPQGSPGETNTRGGKR